MLWWIVGGAVWVVWLVCGVFAYAGTFAFLQRAYPTLAEQDYTSDRGMAVFAGLLGPLGLGLLVLFTNEQGEGIGKFGLKWK